MKRFNQSFVDEKELVRIDDFARDKAIEEKEWDKGENARIWKENNPGVKPYYSTPKRVGNEYVLYRIVTKKQLDFIRKHKGLFPHKEITSLGDRGIVPTSASVKYLKEIIKGSYYKNDKMFLLRILVPKNTKIVEWEAGFNIGLPYFVPMSCITAVQSLE